MLFNIILQGILFSFSSKDSPAFDSFVSWFVSGSAMFFTVSPAGHQSCTGNPSWYPTQAGSRPTTLSIVFDNSFRFRKATVLGACVSSSLCVFTAVLTRIILSWFSRVLPAFLSPWVVVSVETYCRFCHLVLESRHVNMIYHQSNANKVRLKYVYSPSLEEAAIEAHYRTASTSSWSKLMRNPEVYVIDKALVYLNTSFLKRPSIMSKTVLQSEQFCCGDKFLFLFILSDTAAHFLFCYYEIIPRPARLSSRELSYE